MPSRALVLLAVLLAAALAGCIRPGTSAADRICGDPDRTYPIKAPANTTMRTLLAGSRGGFPPDVEPTTRRLVVDDADRWASVAADLTGDDGPTPTVVFGEECVLVAVDHPDSACDMVRFTDLDRLSANDTIRATVTSFEQTPGGACIAAVVSQHHAVAVEATGKPVVFVERQVTYYSTQIANWTIGDPDVATEPVDAPPWTGLDVPAPLAATGTEGIDALDVALPEGPPGRNRNVLVEVIMHGSGNVTIQGDACGLYLARQRSDFAPIVASPPGAGTDNRTVLSEDQPCSTQVNLSEMRSTIQGEGVPWSPAVGENTYHLLFTGIARGDGAGGPVVASATFEIQGPLLA